MKKYCGPKNEKDRRFPWVILLKKLKDRRGVALPMALSCILIVSILVLEFSFTQDLSKNLAYNDYETLRAEYLAKSGLNISLLKLKIHGRAVKLLKEVVSPALINKIIAVPISYPLADMLVPAGTPQGEEGRGAVEKEEADDLLEGRFIAITKAETGMNLNWQLDDSFLTGKRGDSGLEIYNKNIDTFKEKMKKSFEEKMEESKYGDERFYRKYRDLNFEVVLNNVIDWVDRDSRSLNGGDEDEYYQKEDPPYRAKNGYLDTLRELLLVEGVTDDLFELFEGQYSVYSEGKFLIEDIVNMPEMLKWLSEPELTADNINEIQEDFRKEETDWKDNVEKFQEHIRSTYRVDFNDSDTSAPKTNYVKLSTGDDIDRYFIKSAGVFRKTSYTIETVVDRSDDTRMVYLYYNYY